MNTHFVRGGWLILVLLALLGAALPTPAAAPLVNAILEPAQISLGDSAQLTITSSGTGMEPITLPEVPGLEFRVVGQSRRVEMINGATLATTSIIVRVTPQSAGIFTIPGITPRSQPLVLRVNPDNGSAPPSGNPNSPNRAPVIPGGSAANGVKLTADGAAFIRLVLPKHEAYVGESLPVEIEVGMRSGVVTSLNGLPTLSGGDFTLNNLSRQPERVEKLIDGTPFTLLTWHSVLAPVKPGNFTLSVSSPLTIRVRTRPQRDSMIDDLLGDPFLQNFFGATVPKDITVTSPTAELSVLPLPEGRPADFSGAVGSFKVTSDLSSTTTAATGDPLTLRMHVSGTGNFDRVDSPMLEHIEQWKTYPPKSSFAPGDTVGYKGEKTFEQPLIASRPGAQTLPALTFSYFDPTTRRYETARSAPLEVTITPALADSTLTAPPAAAGAAKPAAKTAAASPPLPGLRPDHVLTDKSARELAPLYLQPQFLAFPSVLALVFAGGWAGLRRRADGRDPPRRRERKLSAAAAAVLADMETAVRRNDGTLFFTAARDGLQQHLAARWQIAPDQVAVELARLGSDGDDLRQLFALADEARYSGHALTATDFARWTSVVRRQLLEKSS